MPSAEESLQERVNYINEVAKQDSILKSKIDWSGHYVFNDASSEQSTQWILNIVKSNAKHAAKLIINDSNNKVEIDCDAVLKNQTIEFYPDTTYAIRGQTKITYYDCLFSLSKVDGEIYTIWDNLTSFHSNINNSSDIFKLQSVH